MKSQIADSYVMGTGSAINVECGFYPRRVTVTNLTDGDLITDAYLAPVSAFTSGGTAVLADGDVIVGATSGARARIRQVIVNSATWSAGTATGWIILYQDSITGTFSAGELIYVYGNAAASVDDATMTAAPISINTATSTAVATASTTSAISLYNGASGSASRGFTIGSVVSESGKLLHWEARRSDA